MSRRHCAVVLEGSGLTVEDLKSRNGTYVNGVKIAAKVAVTDGDILRVGPLELKVSCAVPNAPAMDDVSRWLMADDEPAGMFDTTQTVKAADVAAAVSNEDASSGSVVAVGAESEVVGGDSSVSAATSSIDALLAARSQMGGLPSEARAPKTNNSKDAAADALKKFFGKR